MLLSLFIWKQYGTRLQDLKGLLFFYLLDFIIKRPNRRKIDSDLDIFLSFLRKHTHIGTLIQLYTRIFISYKQINTDSYN